MNNLWIRGTSILPSFDHNYKKNIFNKGCTGCPSRIYFNDTPYTLGFGHLFEGSYQSYSYDTPQQDSIMNYRVNKAMETIRKTIKKQNQYRF